MRWLFLLMVAVNIAIYIWGLQRETDTSVELDPRYRNIGEIKLLSKAEIEASATEQTSENDNTVEPLVSSEQRIGNEEYSPTVTPEASESDLSYRSSGSSILIVPIFPSTVTSMPVLRTL